MKLYTEEQVREAMKNATSYYEISGHVDMILNALTPIELPSNEEIDKKSHYKVSNNTKTPNWYFIEGAKWMKEQILNQNKEEKCYAFISQIDGKNTKCLKCGKDIFEHYNQNK